MSTLFPKTYTSVVFRFQFVCWFFLLIGDTDPPAIQCPPPLTSQTTCGTTSQQLTFQRPSGFDASGIPDVQCRAANNVQLTLLPGTNIYSGNFPTGTTTITCTATDSCNLSNSCTVSATVSGGKFSVRFDFYYFL